MFNKSRGFTLIEIVLVLAIAGLLLVMVFLAVSGAQRNRRDTQRKNDLGRIAGLVESVASNARGVYPTAADIANKNSSFNTQYNTLKAIDPTAGEQYDLNTNFGQCQSDKAMKNHGPGYVSYTTPGVNGYAYKLRVCLEGAEEFYIGN